MSGAESIGAILVAFFIVTVSPGPANLAVATVSMSAGRRSGMMFGAGLSVGLAFWGLIAATGMGAVLQSSTTVLTVLKICGGFYLLWLAVSSARSAMGPQTPANSQVETGRWFLRGLILNLSNPKAAVAWMAALSMGLAGGSSGGTVVLATLCCMALGFLNYAAYALMFSWSGCRAVYRRFRRWIDGVVAGLLAAAGLGLIRSALTR